MEGRIYKITNQVNGKFYVGRTIKSLQHRFRNHCYEALERNSKNYFHKAIRKYGKENFIVEQIEICDPNSIGEREMFWICELNPHYNQTLGGDGGMLGFKHSEKTKSILSEKRMGKFTGDKNPFYGQHHTEETKQKLSEFRKGKRFSKGFTGKFHKEESKSKTSQTLKNNPNVKRVKVFQYDIEENFLREFQSIADAAQFVNTSPSNIKYTCEGKFKHCKGYKWSYEKLNT